MIQFILDILFAGQDNPVQSLQGGRVVEKVIFLRDVICGRPLTHLELN